MLMSPHSHMSALLWVVAVEIHHQVTLSGDHLFGDSWDYIRQSNTDTCACSDISPYCAVKSWMDSDALASLLQLQASWTDVALRGVTCALPVSHFDYTLREYLLII